MLSYLHKLVAEKLNKMLDDAKGFIFQKLGSEWINKIWTSLNISW